MAALIPYDLTAQSFNQPAIQPSKEQLQPDNDDNILFHS